jgi:hypothetical protein
MFYLADPYYTYAFVCFYLSIDLSSSFITGIPEPIPEKHDTFLDVEPWTGAVMRAHQRLQVGFSHHISFCLIPLQINVQIVRSENLNLTQHVAYIPPYVQGGPSFGFYVPVMYGDENGQLTPHLASKFKNSV